MSERRTPDDDERDAAIDAAWRAQSREEPPAAIDEAIRAAARSEADARAVPAARPLQRWMRWTPIAAAAGIAVLAFGVSESDL